MAPTEDAEVSFQAALKDKNYRNRCNLLSALGRRIKARGLAPAALEDLLDGLGGSADVGGAAQAFAAHARLLVAKAAACLGYGRKFLDHPSQTVRFEAVRGRGLLSAEDARTTFLSPGSSRTLKKMFVKCPVLVSDAEVIEHAWQLFEEDLDTMWEFMLRIDCQDLFKLWVKKKSSGRISDGLEESKFKGVAKFVRKFPQLAIEFVKCGTMQWSWYWAKDLLHDFPEQVLKNVSRGADAGVGPHKGYDPSAPRQDFCELAESWGWRCQPEIMLSIIKEASPDKSELQQPSSSLCWQQRNDIRRVVSRLSTVHSTRHYLTNNRKMELLLRAWSLLSDTVKDDLDKDRGMAHHFVELLPKGSDQRSGELDKILETMWEIVGDVGLANRRILLVGEGKRPVRATAFLKMSVQKVPVPQAIEKIFFRILQECEAGREAYMFMQHDICGTEDGRHDELMLRVFERYLQKVDEEGKGEDGQQCVLMFDVLLKAAKSQDVIQRAFDLLVAKLGGSMELLLLRSVVRRLGTLDAQYCKSQDPTDPASKIKTKIPVATLPVPVEWVCFVNPPPNVAPHIDFLLMVLHSGRGGNDLLGAMMNKSGRNFFWDTFDTVLSWLSNKSDKQSGTELMQKLPPLKAEAFKRVEVASFVRIEPGKLATNTSKDWADAATTAFTDYFADRGMAKKQVNAKDPNVRNEGYSTLLNLAANCNHNAQPFDDLVPYLKQRFNSEQEACRSHILSTLFDKLPFELWEGHFNSSLRSIFTLSSKARESDKYLCYWQVAGTKIVEHCLRTWVAGQGVTEFCLFGLEVAGTLDLPRMLVKAARELNPEKDNTVARDPDALMSAGHWVLQTTVPLDTDTGVPLSTFWSTLKTLGELEKDHGSERVLWQHWPFLHQWWGSLLCKGCNQKSSEFIFTTVVDGLLERQGVYTKPPVGLTPGRTEASARVSAARLKHPHSEPWWELIECVEYKTAVAGVLRQIESGEIPAKEGSMMLLRRVQILQRVARHTPIKVKRRGALQAWAAFPRTRVRTELVDNLACESGTARHEAKFTGKAWMDKEQWDIQKNHRYGFLPWKMYRMQDSLAAQEVKTLQKVLAGGQAQRQVMWRIAELAAVLSGPEIAHLVESAIELLDPKFEGRARCIGRHFPYLNLALAREQASSPDVLTPLVELWLVDDSTRDGRVQKLMERLDCEYFLFFGQSFSRHLSNMRQEWLHKCLEKLSCDHETPEFFHFLYRGPKLLDLAMLAKGASGWRASLTTELDRDLPPTCKLQMYLWHPDTQTEFLQKALPLTDLPTLSVLPRLTWADSFSKVSQILEVYPKENTKQSTHDVWGWEVLQGAGAYSDLATEVSRRFEELPPPLCVDAVEDQQVEVLLTALGRSDDATQSLKVLGSYAGKVKQAKEAVTKMMSKVSPKAARELIRDVLLLKKAGIGLQVAGVKKIAELHIPSAAELYGKAFNGGKCQRDVAVCVLAQAALNGEVSSEDARSFFEYFDLPDKDEVQIYVAENVLDELIKSESGCTKPFMPSVIAKFALLPGVTGKAMCALQKNTVYSTEVVAAVTSIYQAARLASRSEPVHKGDCGQEVQLFKDLAGEASPSKISLLIGHLQGRMLQNSDPKVLLTFVHEVLLIWEESVFHDKASSLSQKEDLLASILSAWSWSLRTERRSEWDGVLNTMLARLVDLGAPPYALQTLAKVVRKRVPEQGFEERDALVTIVGAFLQGLFAAEHVTVCEPAREPPLNTCTNKGYLSAEQAKYERGCRIVLEEWAELLAAGGPEAETDALFKLCPPFRERELAEKLVKLAVAAARRQVRPDDDYRAGGVKLADLVAGSTACGIVTRSTKQSGVFLDFGCVRDGKLEVPEMDYLKYRVGDVVDNVVVNKVEISSKSAKEGSIGLLPPSAPSGQVDRASARTVARRALKWLASPPELRVRRWDTLTKLFAEVSALDSDGSYFLQDMQLLGEIDTPSEMISLVERVLERTPGRPLVREALRWLSERCPAEAVRLWPALLARGSAKEPVEMADVEALLKLCAHHYLPFPRVEGIVAKGLPDEVLVRLAAADRMPEARLAAVQALQQQQHRHGTPPLLLKELKSDGCTIVRTAACMLWKALGGPEDKKADNDDEGMEEVVADA